MGYAIGRVLLCLRPFAGFGNNTLRLVAVLGGHLTMRCQYLGGCQGMLLLAGRTCGDLRRLGAGNSPSLHFFFDLLAAQAGGFQVVGGIGLDFRCSAFAPLDLVAKPAQAIHQLRLVHRRHKVLALKEGLLLQCPRRSVRPLGHIEDDGMGVELPGAA